MSIAAKTFSTLPPLGALLSALLFAAGCNGDKSERRPESTSAAATTIDRKNDWTITVRGLGPLQAGMSRADAETVLGTSLATNGDSDWKNCGYARSDSLPSGTRIMVEGGTIARIDVDSTAQVPTAEGIRIGDSEARVQGAYAGRIAATPHKYVNGHYLTVRSLAPADSDFRIVFETDGQRVTRYRAGRRPPVEYVEGCG